MISISSLPTVSYQLRLKSLRGPASGKNDKKVLEKFPCRKIGRIAVLKKFAMKMPFIVEMMLSVSVWCLISLSSEIMILLSKKLVATTKNAKPYTTIIYW